MLAIAVTANLDFSARFTIAAVFMLVCGILTLVHNGRTGKTHRAAEDKPDDQVEDQKKSYGLKSVLLSTFGMTLFILTLSSVGNSSINAKSPMLRAQRLRHGPNRPSALISLAGLLNIFLFIVAGHGWQGPEHDCSNGWHGRATGGCLGHGAGRHDDKQADFAGRRIHAHFVSKQSFSRISGCCRHAFCDSPAGDQRLGDCIVRCRVVHRRAARRLSRQHGWIQRHQRWMSAIAIGIALLLIFVSLWPAGRKKPGGGNHRPETGFAKTRFLRQETDV